MPRQQANNSSSTDSRTAAQLPLRKAGTYIAPGEAVLALYGDTHSRAAAARMHDTRHLKARLGKWKSWEKFVCPRIHEMTICHPLSRLFMGFGLAIHFSSGLF